MVNEITIWEDGYQDRYKVCKARFDTIDRRWYIVRNKKHRKSRHEKIVEILIYMLAGCFLIIAFYLIGLLI